jgi:DNA-binding response OmpR family regulator
VAEGKILVVEDGVSTGRMIGLILTDAGYDVIGPAMTNICAVDLIASHTPDAAFLDVTLGSVTSFPVAELLTSLGIPFAFLTGEDRASYRFTCEMRFSFPSLLVSMICCPPPRR